MRSTLAPGNTKDARMSFPHISDLLSSEFSITDSTPESNNIKRFEENITPWHCAVPPICYIVAYFLANGAHKLTEEGISMNGSLVNLNEMLVGNKIYDIPVYQRSYAWEQENLEDLWEDLYYLDISKQHYFGTVLIKDSGKTAQAALTTLKRFDVIDGQQRLTTVLILLREIIFQLKEVSGDELKEEVTDLEKNYLKNGEHYKLNPLGDDCDFSIMS